IVDYLFRWLASKFLDEEARREVGVIAPEARADAAPIAAAGQTQIEPARVEPGPAAGAGARSRQAFINQADAPPCPDCGCLMVRNGTCYKCLNCGATSGCS